MKPNWSMLCLLAPLAHCEKTIYLDPACGQQEIQTITTAIQSVYARAERGVRFLDRNIQGTDPDLDATVDQLLKQRVMDRVNVRGILSNVQGMRSMQLLVLDPAVHKVTWSDVVIHCDHTRLANTRATAQTLWDPTQGTFIAKGGLVDGEGCRRGRNGFTGNMLTRAVVMGPSPLGDDEHSTDYNNYDGHEHQPEVIQLCASTMENIRDATKNNWLLNRDIIEAAVSNPLNDESSKDEDKGIDLLATMEHVFLHEFTHLIRNGRTIDGSGEEQCYGWASAGKCKNFNHADTVAFVGLVADLRYNPAWVPGYSTRRGGSIVPMLPGIGGAQPPGPLPPPPPQQPANPADLPT